jgi:ABC-type branched-subunit amino acid transport system substrate-binding protein
VRRLAPLLLLAGVLAGCGGSKSVPTKTFLIVVNAPFSQSSYIGETIARGASLATLPLQGSENNATYNFKVQRLDNALSAAQSVRNVRRAVSEHAGVIVTDGTGLDASWRIAAAANIPICITFDGGGGLVDPERRPNVFRIAPTDHGMAFRLAEYLIPKYAKIGLLHDDSEYGREGASALRQAFRENPSAVAIREVLPTGNADLTPEVLRARRAGATALIVWAGPATIANVVIAARSNGWRVPVLTPASGENPLLRQQLADHRDWITGVTFAAGRMTAEIGPVPFLNFQRAYVGTYGRQLVGVKTRAGRPVSQPPDYAMYAYDFIRVVAQALIPAGGPGAKLIEQLNQVDVRGANGDERGFNVYSHEGVVDDDVYFARFTPDFTFVPVRDDPLSSRLPIIDQTH